MPDLLSIDPDALHFYQTENVSVDVAVVGRFKENTYFLRRLDRREVVLIDPGAEPERLCRIIEESLWQPVAILNTHGHLDHFGAVCKLKEAFDIPFLLHREDHPILQRSAMTARMYNVTQPRVPIVDRWLEGGESLELAGMSIDAIHTPGHTPGSICYALPGIVFVGDVLFRDAVGRTDFPGGDYLSLTQSITEKLWALPPETRVFPGHGRETTIERERTNNPYLL